MINDNYTSEGTDICATVVWSAEINKVQDKNLASGGIIFWAKDNANFYQMTVDALGNIVVNRMIAGTWSVVAKKTNQELKLARLAPSDKNEIEVQITGSHAAVMLKVKALIETY